MEIFNISITAKPSIFMFIFIDMFREDCKFM